MGFISKFKKKAEKFGRYFKTLKDGTKLGGKIGPDGSYVPGELGASQIASMSLPPRAERRRAARTNFQPAYNGPQPNYITPMIMMAKEEKQRKYKERRAQRK